MSVAVALSEPYCPHCKDPLSRCMCKAVKMNPQYYDNGGMTCKCGRPMERDQAGWYCPECREASPDCACTVLMTPGASWRPVDLTAAVDGGNVDAVPVLLERDDGARLFYNGKVHTVAGESESLKTWLVLLACATVINEHCHALFIDYEDSADEIVRRLIALGCSREGILAYFHYSRPDEPYGPPAAVVIRQSLPDPMAIVVIDGVTEAMESHGLDPLSNSEVAAFNAKLPRPFAATGSIVVMIDHVTKSREGRGRYAIGAQHKLSAVTGAAYTIDLIRPFGHGQHGIAKITLAKDRPGHVRTGPGRFAGMLHLRSQDDGSVLAEITAPDTAPTGQEPGPFRPTVLMQRVSEYVEANPGLTVRAILAGVSGKTDSKKLAIELLVNEGYIVAEKAGTAHKHKSDHPFRIDSSEES